jgi:hypothetical protein
MGAAQIQAVIEATTGGRSKRIGWIRDEGCEHQGAPIISGWCNLRHGYVRIC